MMLRAMAGWLADGFRVGGDHTMTSTDRLRHAHHLIEMDTH